MTLLSEGQLSTAVSAVLSAFPKIISENKSRLANEFRIGVADYLRDSYERWGKIRTLLDRAEPVPLRQYYVASQAKIDHRHIDEASILNGLHTRKRLIVIGTAGAGKSLFLKSLFLQCIESALDQLPVFLEARTIARGSGTASLPLFEAVKESCAAYIPDFSSSRLEQLMRKGKLILFIDGLDEIHPSARPGFYSELNSLAAKYIRTPIICSSRPDSSFRGWELFTHVRLLGLDADRAAKLVDRLPCDPDIKLKFQHEVIFPHFQRYDEFLSVPLLLVMMLMVYTQHGDIPERMAHFYKRAFGVLFSGHDMLKGGFRRATQTGLKEEDFSRVFAAFCAVTYVANNYKFSHTEILEFISQAINYEGIKAEPEEFLNDMISSVCLIQNEADNEYSFVHRSFQEYYMAEFCVNFNGDVNTKARLFDSITLRMGSDRTTALMWQIDRVAFARNWALPLLKDLLATPVERSAQSESAHWWSFARENIAAIRVLKYDKAVGLGDVQLTPLMRKFIWAGELCRHKGERSDLYGGFWLHHTLDRALGRLQTLDVKDQTGVLYKGDSAKQLLESVKGTIAPKIRSTARRIREFYSDLLSMDIERSRAERGLFGRQD